MEMREGVERLCRSLPTGVSGKAELGAKKTGRKSFDHPALSKFGLP